jgi:hypothetical protein
MKTWATSKTNKLALVIAVLTGITAGVTEASGTFPLPSWLVALVGVVTMTLIPMLRGVTSTGLASPWKSIASVLVAAIVGFSGAVIGVSASDPSVPVPSGDIIEVSPDVIESDSDTTSSGDIESELPSLRVS